MFGPVLTLLAFDDEADAVHIANGTEYGTRRRHLDARRRAPAPGRQAGARWPGVRQRLLAPGGGIEPAVRRFRKSGHGREKGFEALYDMSATKTIVFNHG